MRYATKETHGDEARIVDVVEIPDPLPAWAVDAAAFLAALYPGKDGWFRLLQDVGNGAIEQQDGSFVQPVIQVQKLPRVLSKTAFQDYAVSQLGGGMTGMARFTAIMDATRDSASGAVRFAFERYEAANTFEKTNTATLTAIMAADTTSGHITTDERTAIINNWPDA